ncbi:cytochrome c family protein [bacterium]|nr:cytochrome c family protein [bacterium]
MHRHPILAAKRLCAAPGPRRSLRGTAAQSTALLALLVLLLSGCPGKDTGAGGTDTQQQSSTRAAVPAATIAYIGNFRGFQRPCGCDQRQDGGLLRLATVLRVLRGEISAEEAMLDPSELPHGLSQKIEPTGSIPGQPAVDSAADSAADAEAGKATEPADKQAETEAEAAGMAGGAAATDTAMVPGPAVPLQPPADAALDPLWLLDCGNFTDQSNRLPGFRSATHLKALAQLGARAAVLGSAEAALDSEQARLAFADSPLPLLSCNLKSSLAEIKPKASLELAPGWYVIGLTAPDGAGGGFASGGLALRRKLGGHQDSGEAQSWASVEDPVSSLKAELARLPKDALVLVACAQMPEGLLAQISVLGPALIIGAQREADFEPRTENLPLPALLEAPVRRGLLASFVSLKRPQPGEWEQARATFWSYRLATGVRDDQKMDELLKAQDAESLQVAFSSDEWENNKWGQDESFLPPDMRKRGSIVPGYTGSAACKDCHPAEYAKWESSGHSHAFSTLVRHDAASTMDCLECHVVGLLEPGGFLPASAQPALAAVGCESCHGPGGEHIGLAQRIDPSELSPVAIESGKLPRMDKKAIARGDLANCVYCHDDFNSPDFRLEEYWPQVQH